MADLTDDQKERLRELAEVAGKAHRQGFTALEAQAGREALTLLPAVLDENDRLRAENEAGRKLNVYQAQRLADLHLDAMGRGEGGDRG